MLRFFKIIFYQQYKWNLKYDLSERIASLRAGSLISLFVILNAVSVYWAIEHMIGHKLLSQNIGMILFLILVITQIVYSSFYLNKNKRYLKIYKEISKENINFLGLTSVGITYWYYLISVLLFVGMAAINISFFKSK